MALIKNDAVDLLKTVMLIGNDYTDLLKMIAQISKGIKPITFTR